MLIVTETAVDEGQFPRTVRRQVVTLEPMSARSPSEF